MADRKITAKVVEARGKGCDLGLKLGDEFVMDVEKGCQFCAWAYNAIFPFAQSMKYGGAFPWEADPNSTLVACPDPYNTIVFRLTAVDE